MLFEWRIYDVVPGKMMALHERFQNITLEFKSEVTPSKQTEHCALSHSVPKSNFCTGFAAASYFK